MDYLAYALLILALYKWWRYKRRYRDKCRFIAIQARIIDEWRKSNASKDELIETLKHRRDHLKARMPSFIDRN
jgi:hypothetical protein